MMSKREKHPEPQIGDVFGRYTIVSIAPKGSHGQKRVICQCECGTEKIVDYSSLVQGIVRSCGCYGKEKRLIGIKARIKGNDYYIKDGIVYVKASNADKVFLIDECCLPVIQGCTWQIRHNHKKNYCRVEAKRDGKGLELSRIIMGLVAGDGKVVDHINGDPLDNRLENLRVCFQKDNCKNTRGHQNKLWSKYKGVYSRTHGRTFFSAIGCDGKTINLGSFDNEIDAAKAYDEAAKKYHGEFAKLNFCETK